MKVEEVVKAIFKLQPDALIYGKYVANYLLGASELTQGLDFVFQSKSNINTIINYFKNKRFYQHKREFTYLDDSLYLINLKISDRMIYLMISIGKPWIKNTFRALCFSMNYSHGISPIFNQKYNLIEKDIKQKSLYLIDDLKVFKRSHSDFIYRNSYFKIIKDLIELRDTGWIFLDFIDYNVYGGTGDGDCAICLESYLSGYSLVLRCGHIFHLECLEEHVIQLGEYNNNCPLCRGIIFK